MASLGTNAMLKAIPVSNVIEIPTIRKLIAFPKLMTTKHRANSRLPRKIIPLKQ